MLKIDYTVIIQIANFLCLLFLLNIILFRPIRRILGQRRGEMNTFQEMIEDFQGRYTQHENDLEERMIEARRQGNREKEDIKDAALEEEKGVLQEANASAGQRIDRAKEDIGRKALHARQSLEKEVEVFSQELAEKILGRGV